MYTTSLISRLLHETSISHNVYLAWSLSVKCSGLIELMCIYLSFYITSRSHDSACLENRPSPGGVVSPENGDNNTTAGGLLLPGMEYTPTEQCQLQYGNESTHCTGMQVR